MKQVQIQTKFSRHEEKEIKNICREQGWQKTTGKLSNSGTVKALVRFILQLRRNEDVDKHLKKKGMTLTSLIESAVSKCVQKKR